MQRWLHIAGIAGKTTANVALMYRSLGYFVSGSDNNCLPPATDLLDANQIPYVQGYHYTHLTREFWQEKLGKELDIPEVPDRTIFVATLTPHNKEYMFAKAHNVKIQTYAQALGEDLVKKNSIVSVGTAGKTTTTALTVHILKGLGFEPSYMIGAELADGSPALVNTKSDWSVIEGDEFYGVQIEPHSKFFEYKPKYVYLNKITWDHADVFPTEQIYIDNFRQLLKSMPRGGIVLANAADSNIRTIAQSASCQVKWFAADAEVDEFINADGVKLYWHLEKRDDLYVAIAPPYVRFEFAFTTKLIGRYNLQNVLAVVAMLYELFADNLDWELVRKLIAEFQGIHKRLEVLYENENIVVVDDLGGPPLKVKTGLEALKEKYPDYNIIAAYEPNSGNRKMESIGEYRDTMNLADLMIIPSLSTNDETLLSAEQLVDELHKLNIQQAVSVNTDDLNNYVLAHLDKNRPNLIIYFSSYRLTTNARELVKNL